MRYNFLVFEQAGFPLSVMRDAPVDRVADLYVKGELIWGLQTYRMLKEAGMEVTLSSEPDPAAINLAHVNVLRKLKYRADCFCISIQADCPHYSLADYHVVQNMEQSSKNAVFIPHWPQPEQVARAPGRDVQRIAYQGNQAFTELDEQRINDDLRSHGLRFDMLGESDWAELETVDVLLGIRSFSRKQYRRKPATKLTNAWHAGIPFIGGWDSAYAQLGCPGVDYLRVDSYPALIDAVLRLKHEPELYRNLVDTGYKNVGVYRAPALVNRWISFLEHEAADAFNRWVSMEGRSVSGAVKNMIYSLNEAGRRGVQSAYAIPGIKRIRDRYYDPVR